MRAWMLCTVVRLLRRLWQFPRVWTTFSGSLIRHKDTESDLPGILRWHYERGKHTRTQHWPGGNLIKMFTRIIYRPGLHFVSHPTMFGSNFICLPISKGQNNLSGKVNDMQCENCTTKMNECLLKPDLPGLSIQPNCQLPRQMLLLSLNCDRAICRSMIGKTAIQFGNMTMCWRHFS